MIKPYLFLNGCVIVILPLLTAVIILFLLYGKLSKQLNRLEKKLTAAQAPMENLRTQPEQDISSNNTIHTPLATEEKQAKPGFDSIAIEKSSNKKIHWLIETLQRNVLAKIGVILLFLASVFFAKYAYAHQIISYLEIFAMTMALSIALLLIGLLWRKAGDSYRFALQGGGLGIGYINILFAHHYLILRVNEWSSFRIISSNISLTVAICISLLCTLLALIQNAYSLMGLAFLCGFAAPLFVQDIFSNYMLCLSYYLILNLCITYIAYFKAWRTLFWSGFFATFILAAVWGWYRSHNPVFANWDGQNYFLFNSECFLVAFFILYCLIGIFYARNKDPLRTEAYVDAPLVFGVPLACLILQVDLVQWNAYALMLSTFFAALFYIILASGLKKINRFFYPLSTAFYAISLFLWTAFIPLFLSLRATPIFFRTAPPYMLTHTASFIPAWALESLAIIWFSVRQKERRLTLFGIGLHVLTQIYFFALYFFSTYWASGRIASHIMAISLLLAGTNIAIAYLLDRNPDGSSRQKCYSTISFIVSLFWLGMTWKNLYDAYSPSLSQLNQSVPWLFGNSNPLWMSTFVAYLVCASFLGFILYWLLRWQKLTRLGYLLFIALLTSLTINDQVNICWLLLFAAWGVFLSTQKQLAPWKQKFFSQSTRIIFCLQIVFFALNQPASERFMSASLCLIALLALLFNSASRYRFVPTNAYHFYQTSCNTTILVLAGGLIFLSGNYSGDTLGYFGALPLLNLLDLPCIILLLLMFHWQQHNAKQITRYLVWIGLLTLTWISAALLRIMHHYDHVPFSLAEFFTSTLTQSILSLIWGGLALLLIGSTRYNAKRSLWFAGSILLGITCLKLLFVDMGQVNTLSRIIVFFVLGILLLVIDYLSPLPPHRKK